MLQTTNQGTARKQQERNSSSLQVRFFIIAHRGNTWWISLHQRRAKAGVTQIFCRNKNTPSWPSPLWQWLRCGTPGAVNFPELLDSAEHPEWISWALQGAAILTNASFLLKYSLRRVLAFSTDSHHKPSCQHPRGMISFPEVKQVEIHWCELLEQPGFLQLHQAMHQGISRSCFIFLRARKKPKNIVQTPAEPCHPLFFSWHTSALSCNTLLIHPSWMLRMGKNHWIITGVLLDFRSESPKLEIMKGLQPLHPQQHPKILNLFRPWSPLLHYKYLP